MIIIILGFTLGNHYRHNYIYRPTEIECFRNIEREEKIKREWGYYPSFTYFEKRVYKLDLELKSKIIPNAINHNKSAINHSEEMRVPIVTHEIAKITEHTPDYISKVLETIDNKVWIRQRLKIYPFLPEVDKVKI